MEKQNAPILTDKSGFGSEIEKKLKKVPESIQDALKKLKEDFDYKFTRSVGFDKNISPAKRKSILKEMDEKECKEFIKDYLPLAVKVYNEIGMKDEKEEFSKLVTEKFSNMLKTNSYASLEVYLRISEVVLDAAVTEFDEFDKCFEYSDIEPAIADLCGYLNDTKNLLPKFKKLYNSQAEWDANKLYGAEDNDEDGTTV